MKCSICGHPIPAGSERCPDCGHRCQTAHTQSQTYRTGPYYTPPNRTKRPRGCCCAAILIVPIVLTVIAAVFGFMVNIMSEFDPEDFGVGIYEEEPVPEPRPEGLPAELPDEADESCFSIRGGAVTFLPDRWDGSQVLRLPETVNGETVTALAPGCFKNCSQLTTIILPDTVTQIGREAFFGCTALRGLYLPLGTETIGPRAFGGCISMESIYIPGSVTRIAEGCFDDCAALLYLFYEGEFESWNALYSDYITPYTAAICLDGSFHQGAGG